MRDYEVQMWVDGRDYGTFGARAHDEKDAELIVFHGVLDEGLLPEVYDNITYSVTLAQPPMETKDT